MPKDEEVLVVPAMLLEQIGSFSGFQPDVGRYLPALLDRKHQSFLPRSRCETDHTFKQLIPYVILECTTADGTRVFQYTRGKGQGEARLHAKRSLGIGGHISTEDTHGDDLYRTGMQRELDEEMEIECGCRNDRIVGLIYDDTTEVGKVHLGIVHILQLHSCHAKAREDELVDAGFRSIDEIKQQRSHFETWSQLCLDHLF
jgi:predicted NUDIX family phosphoesterase